MEGRPRQEILESLPQIVRHGIAVTAAGAHRPPRPGPPRSPHRPATGRAGPPSRRSAPGPRSPPGRRIWSGPTAGVVRGTIRAMVASAAMKIMSSGIVGVAHPHRDDPRRAVDEQHAGVPGQAAAEHQPLTLLALAHGERHGEAVHGRAADDRQRRHGKPHQAALRPARVRRRHRASPSRAPARRKSTAAHGTSLARARGTVKAGGLPSWHRAAIVVAHWGEPHHRLRGPDPGTTPRT